MTVFSGIKHIWQTERRGACCLRLLLRAKERFAGRLRAWVLGWPQGFIGDSPRVIGTAFIEVGPKCSIGRFSWIEAIVGSPNSNPILKLGANFSASERFHVASINQVIIGDGCLVGSGVHITDHNHGSYKGAGHSQPSEPPIQRRLVSNGAVKIGARVWIGDNVVIVGPAIIGDGAVVGANSVVSGEVPAQTMVIGAPARVVKIFNTETGRWERKSSDPCCPS